MRGGALPQPGPEILAGRIATWKILSGFVTVSQIRIWGQLEFDFTKFVKNIKCKKFGHFAFVSESFRIFQNMKYTYSKHKKSTKFVVKVQIQEVKCRILFYLVYSF